ncbi:hypothetical protein ACFQU2_33435 [Siccirubricoccus deserti]
MALAGAGHKVALLDTDPQASLGHWYNVRQKLGDKVAPLTFDSPAGWRTPAALDRLRRAEDFIIVDTPACRDRYPALDPRRRSGAAAAAALAGGFLGQRRDFEAGRRRGRYVAAVLNRVPPQGRLKESIAAALVEKG